jgi:hypothetical protein
LLRVEGAKVVSSRWLEEQPRTATDRAKSPAGSPAGRAGNEEEQAEKAAKKQVARPEPETREASAKKPAPVAPRRKKSEESRTRFRRLVISFPASRKAEILEVLKKLQTRFTRRGRPDDLRSRLVQSLEEAQRTTAGGFGFADKEPAQPADAPKKVAGKKDAAPLQYLVIEVIEPSGR